MTTYQKVVRLLGDNLAALLHLTDKLFIEWKLDAKLFMHTINHLKKEQVIGLMDGTYELVKKVKTNLFIFTDFFFTKSGLVIDESPRMQSIRNANKAPKEYKSIKDLELAFDLDCNMYDNEIIEKLGGEDKVRKNAVCMSQIEQLIKAQWGGRHGVMLNNGRANIFYVIGENNQLFAVRVNWRSNDEKWSVGAVGLDQRGYWGQGRRVFSNKNLVS